ncbi:MAG: class I SAM-dependent methyltransferase [Synergistaceae bacterium]|nr:class I SAM-dependent methyltransferase [Synergistaceae bacterium]
MECYEARGWKGRLFTGSLFFHKLFARAMGRDVMAVRKYSYPLNTYEPRVATLELAAREIYRYGVEGAAAEVGVYRGDFSRAVNHFFPDRKLYLFDTFEGFDERNKAFDRAEELSDTGDDFSGTSVDLVLSKMEYPGNCVVRKGWFPDTAEGVDDKFCFVSIDADLYQPILAGLEYFYPRLNHGGVIMVHDFNYEGYKGSRQAVTEFCGKNNIGYVCIPDSYGSAVIAK